MYNYFAFGEGGGAVEKETLKFKFFYFLRYFGDALFYPFMSIYFISKGLSEGQTGIILAIIPITTILVNPGWNYIAKDTRISQLILKIMTALEGMFIILITRVSTFEVYAILIAMIGVFCSPFISIQDGFTATFTKEKGMEFSAIRIYASIAYVIATTVAGFIAKYLSYEIMFLAAGIFFLLTSLVAMWIRPLHPRENPAELPRRDLKSLFQNREFYKYLLFYTLVVGAVRVGDSFFGIFMTDDLGLGALWYGILYSCFVLVEVITLRFMTIRGNLFDEKKLFLVGTVAFLLRYLAYCFPLPMGVVIAFTMLRGLSWGIYIYAHIRYITRIVKVENITAAILVVTLLYSIFTALGNLLGGWLIETVGYYQFFIVQTVLIFIGLVSFLVFTPKIDPSKIHG